MYLQPGDTSFLGLAPTSAGAMVRTCIALVVLSMAERWLVAMRGVMEEWRHTDTCGLASHCPPVICFLMHWPCSDQVALTNSLNTSVAAMSLEERSRPLSKAPLPPLDVALPFVFAYDVLRGVLWIGLASIHLLALTIIEDVSQSLLDVDVPAENHHHPWSLAPV